MTKKILICFDRDGTLNYDKNYFLGSQSDWKKKVKLMPGVISGLKKLQKTNKVILAIITNQAGSAILNYPLLTVNKTKELQRYFIDLFKKKGIKFSGYETCNYVSPKYVKTHPQYQFDKRRVKDHPCLKPKPGMILKILKKNKLNNKNTSIYVIGDRATDVQTALNINGFGILVPTKDRPKEIEKTKKLKSKQAYVAKSFNKAVDFIIKREKIK